MEQNLKSNHGPESFASLLSLKMGKIATYFYAHENNLAE